MENNLIITHYIEKPAVVSYKVTCEFTEQELLNILNKEVENPDDYWTVGALEDPENIDWLKEQTEEFLSTLEHKVDEIVVPDFDPIDYQEHTTISKVIGSHDQFNRSYIFYK